MSHQSHIKKTTTFEWSLVLSELGKKISFSLQFSLKQRVNKNIWKLRENEFSDLHPGKETRPEKLKKKKVWSTSPLPVMRLQNYWRRIKITLWNSLCMRKMTLSIEKLCLEQQWCIAICDNFHNLVNFFIIFLSRTIRSLLACSKAASRGILLPFMILWMQV